MAGIVWFYLLELSKGKETTFPFFIVCPSVGTRRTQTFAFNRLSRHFAAV
jgi:hypothetical protein